MSLDLFQTDNRDAINNAERGSAPLLPATYKESFDAAWDNAVVFGQSFASINARHRAMHDVLQEAYTKTGDERFRRDSPQFEGRFHNPTAGSKDMADIYNGIVAERAKEAPERQASGYPPSTLAPITPELIDARAADISKDARDAFKVMGARQGSGFGSFVGNIAGTVIDPVNLVTFPLAAPEALGVLKSGLAWAGIGGGTQAAIETLGAPFRETVEPGYIDSGEPTANVAGAAVFAGTLGSTIKALGTGWRWYRNKAEVPRTIRDAGNVLDSETQIAETNPLRGPEGEVAHRAALSKTIDDVVKGDAPNVDSIITPEMMDGYQSRLTPIMKARTAAIDAHEQAAFLAREDARLPGTMERLSEMQLGDIRGAVDALDTGLATRTTELTEGVTKARTAVTEHTAMLQGLRDQRDNLEEIVSPAVRVEGKIYRDTNHADALHKAADALGRKFDEIVDSGRFDEGYVTSEREFVTRRAGEKIDRQKTTLGKKITAGEAKLEKLAADAEKRAGELPLRQVTAEARAATRKGRTTAEMTKAIDNLAEDGYGLKLDPADTARLADRILKAPADDLEVALRETTEELVDKARAQRALAPPTPFGEARPHEEQAAHALRITNVMRMRIQTLAREVGYAMPKEEAGAIAARMLEVKEPDALAILDELVLRPRTIAKTMAEPRPTVPEGIPTPPERAVTEPPAPTAPQTVIEDRGDGSFLVKHTNDVLSLKMEKDGALHVGMVTVGKEKRGQGIAVAMYEKALELAGERGTVLRSDMSVHNDAVRVYDALKRRGYEVTEAADSAHTKAGVSNVREGYVYEVKPKPAEAPAKLTFEGAPRADYVDKVGSGEHPLPTVADLTSTIKATEDAEKKYYIRHGLTEEEYKRLGTLDRTIDNVGGERADAAIAEKKAIIAKLPEETKTHEFDLPDQATLKQLRSEFEALERSAGETPAEHLDGMSRVLKRYINDVMDGDPFARAIFRKAMDEARKAGFDTKQLTNDTMRRLFGDLSESDRAFMRQEFENFMRPKVEAPVVEPVRPTDVPPAYERAAAEQMLPKNVEKLRTDPEMTATLDRDLQRMRAETPDKEIPVGVDKDGAPITKTVEETATDIEQRKALADEIRASCGPQPEPTDGGE